MEFHYKNLSQLKMGMTKLEVEKLIGKPYAISVADNEQIYDYFFSNSTSFGTLGATSRGYERQTAHLEFVDDKLTKYSFDIMEPKK